MRKKYYSPICEQFFVDEELLSTLSHTSIEGNNPEGVGDGGGPPIGSENETLGAKGTNAIFD